MNFNSISLHATLLSNLEALGYQTPTPIQEQSLPIILEGHDLIGLAQTGTGKTAAFALPILERLLQNPSQHVQALIIVPTRELAEQIHKEFGKLGKGSKLKGVPLYGGVDIRRQFHSLQRGVNIVIACPGRLLDHVSRGTVDLSHVEMLVLDEADHLFDMGFIEKIREILKELPTQRQSLLFSATMPKEVQKLAMDVLKNPKTVRINPSQPVNTVTQKFYPVTDGLKLELLLHLLETVSVSSGVIFTRTKHRATWLAEQLSAQGIAANAFQGNLTQSKRQATLDRFRRGAFSILVATDIAARGIDIAHVSHVINFDMPNTVESYTHRIGRTGRASRLGEAYTFITRADMLLVRGIERTLKQKITQVYLEDFDYKAAPSIVAPIEKQYAASSRRGSGARPPQHSRRNAPPKPGARRHTARNTSHRL